VTGATARPWRHGGKLTKTNGWAVYDIYPKDNGGFFASISFESHDSAEANADLIVRAVNAHDALVEACKAVLANSTRVARAYEAPAVYSLVIKAEQYDAIRAALALAEVGAS